MLNLNVSLCPASEYDAFFLQGMINRMGVSFHKYGAVSDAKGKIDQVASLELRLKKYKDTGNTEFLMDVANLAMIEFMHKGLEAFKATDSRESPGRVWAKDAEFADEEAEVSQRANDGSAAI